MFNADPKALQRIERHIQRVLIVDPHHAAAKLVLDMMKDCGARDILLASTRERGWEIAQAVAPQIVFTEYAAPHFTGPDFVRDLRRSDLPCRQAPVIMITAEATVESIKAARDSGVHEFLRKPFTPRDLFRRVENVTLRSRLWIEAKMYVGPDRRRFNTAAEGYEGPKKRRSDDSSIAPSPNGLDRADAEIRALLDMFAQNPQASLRGMLEQAAELQSMAYHHDNAELTSAITLFQKYLLNAFERGRLSRKTVEHHLAALNALASDSGLRPEARKRLLNELAAAAA